jgi:hypothetical protein
MSDRQFREEVGITEQQKEELSRRLIKGRESSVARKEYEKKLLAVLTPWQWEQIDQLFDSSDAGRFLLTEGPSASGYPGPEWHELEDPQIRKELALSAAQQTKLDDFSAKSQAQSLVLLKVWETGDRPQAAQDSMAQAGLLRKALQEMKKQDRERIEGLLTAQQLAALKRLTIRRVLLDNWFMSGYFENRNHDEKPTGIFQQLKISKDQMQEFRRLGEERSRLLMQSCRQMGETALKTLSPQQQDKFLDALESNGVN